MTYQIAILLHVLGTVVFLGTFVAAWLAYALARRARQADAVAQLFALVDAGDRWLTPIALTVLLASGFAAAAMSGLSVLGTGWIIWSLIALGVSGVVFAGRLLGLQRRLAGLTSAPDPPAAALGDEARGRLLAAWARWAAIGTAAVLTALALMVLKPALPGF